MPFESAASAFKISNTMSKDFGKSKAESSILSGSQQKPQRANEPSTKNVHLAAGGKIDPPVDRFPLVVERLSVRNQTQLQLDCPQIADRTPLPSRKIN
jgi:hypothetical protein